MNEPHRPSIIGPSLLASMSDEDARSLCRVKIESLEHCLRRLVDDVLTARYGSGYFEQRNPAGQLLLGEKRVGDVIRRRTNEPGRYPPVDRRSCSWRLDRDHV